MACIEEGIECTSDALRLYSHVTQQERADDVRAVPRVELTGADQLVDDRRHDRRQVVLLHVQQHSTCNVIACDVTALPMVILHVPQQIGMRGVTRYHYQANIENGREGSHSKYTHKIIAVAFSEETTDC